ncbi:hypothetical protein ABZP36_013213 [Zizania latifolia]
MPSEITSNQVVADGKASTPASREKSGLPKSEAGRSNCRLFGFSLTENMLGAGDEGLEGATNEADCQNPGVLELFVHSHSTAGALHALCAAPLGM